MIFTVAIFVAAVVGYLLWFAQRRRNEVGGSEIVTDAAVRSVRIVALGHKEAGKTVLLASMWRKLAIEGERRVRMVVEMANDQLELQRLCDEIEATDKGFPTSTTLGELKEWKFRLEATNLTGPPVDVFRFSYLDYPGELLDDMAQNRDLPQDFVQALRDADIIVGIIDGQKIAHLMDRGADSGFAVSLSNLCMLLRRREVKTLHIIITKWDLLKGRYSLEQVRERLKEFNELFRLLLETPRSGGVRIIPVSALGTNGFVYEDPQAMVMRKSATKGWFPEYVVAPLGATIPDVLETDVAELRLQGGKRHGKIVVSREQVSQVFLWITLVLGFAVPVGPVPLIVSGAREVFVKVSLESLMESFFKVVNRARDSAIPAVMGEKSGLLHTLRVLREEVERLEREIPAARRALPRSSGIK